MATATGRCGRWLRRWFGVAAAGTVVFTGCSSPQQPESTPEVTLADVGTALHNPVWSYASHTLIGLTDDQRLAKVSDPASPGSAKTTQSVPLGAGRNLQISRVDEGQIFVPQPQRGSVAVVDIASLRPIDHFDAGPAPDYLSEDAGMRILLALSADGLSVTPVDEYGYRKLPTAKVIGDRADSIDGANRGREIDYHLYGPSGIHYYRGHSSPPLQHGTFAMDVAASAGDGAKVARTYVADRNHGVLYAVDFGRGGEALDVSGHAQLPSSPIRYLGTDDTRIYAATDQQLVTLETESFTNFPDRVIPVLKVVDYRAGLPDGQAKSAPLSGMAIGPHRVFLTLRGTPHVVSVAKPRL